MGTRDLAFVVRARPGPGLPWARLDDRPSAHVAGFVVHHHLTWASTDGTTHLDVWLGESDSDMARHWPVDDEVAVLCGYRLGDNGTFEFDGLIADDPAERDRTSHGAYAAAALTAAGTGAVWNDPLGFRCLYIAEGAELSAVGSRAALVAQARPASPDRDLKHAAWNAWLGRWAGNATGFVGVTTLDAGTTVTVEHGHLTRHRLHTPWTAADAIRTLDIAKLADLAIEDITKALTAAAHAPERPILRLTGGRDSRVLLAVANAAGIAERFDYETVGPPGLPDVVVAAELCSRFGLVHQALFLELQSDVAFSDLAADYAQATAGMVNIFDARENRSSDRLTVTGVCGELLRASAPIKREMTDQAGLRRHFRSGRFNQARLVTADLFHELHDELFATMFDGEDVARLSPLDVLQRHSMTSNMRFARLGPNLELPIARTVQPLNSFQATTSAFALDGNQRQAEILVAEILLRTTPDLLDVRFAGPGWSPAVEDHLRAAGYHLSSEPTSPAAQPQPKTPTPEKKTLMQELSTSGGERVEFLREVSTDQSSQAWEVIDRSAMLDALGQFDQLSRADRRNVFGAATAVLWLSQNGA